MHAVNPPPPVSTNGISAQLMLLMVALPLYCPSKGQNNEIADTAYHRLWMIFRRSKRLKDDNLLYINVDEITPSGLIFHSL